MKSDRTSLAARHGQDGLAQTQDARSAEKHVRPVAGRGELEASRKRSMSTSRSAAARLSMRAWCNAMTMTRPRARHTPIGITTACDTTCASQRARRAPAHDDARRVAQGVMAIADAHRGLRFANHKWDFFCLRIRTQHATQRENGTQQRKVRSVGSTQKSNHYPPRTHLYGRKKCTIHAIIYTKHCQNVWWRTRSHGGLNTDGNDECKRGIIYAGVCACVGNGPPAIFSSRHSFQRCQKSAAFVFCCAALRVAWSLAAPRAH